MRYAILCLANGEYIRTKSPAIFRFCETFVRTESNYDTIMHNWYRNVNETRIEFTTKEAADWFIRRRLSFNPNRKESSKLMAMNELFEFNGINPLSRKTEYEIHEIQN
jgi:hypothetical protein